MYTYLLLYKIKNKNLKGLNLNLKKAIISRLNLNSLKGGAADNEEAINSTLPPKTHVYRGCFHDN
ncbi:MAG: hypothetical protein ACI9Y7_002499 [Dokdonia sp.]|jgi:hypothetical protein